MDEINAFLDTQADSYVSFREQLRHRGLDYHEAKKKMQRFTDKYHQLLKCHQISADDLVRTCLDLVDKIKVTPDSSDLQYIYFCIITDRGLLYPSGSEITFEEQRIQNFFQQEEQIQALLRFTAEQLECRLKYQKLKEHLTSPIPSSKVNSSKEHEQICALTAEHTFLYGKTDTAIYRDNVESLLAHLNGDTMLTAVKPYLLFAILTRKHGMMCKRAHYIPNLQAALQYQDYQIDRDNGKNFGYYQSYLELYDHLRRSYEDDPAVDLTLCDYCFADLSPLSEWYYLYCRPEIAIPMTLRQKVSTEMPLSFPVLYRYEDYSDIDVATFESEHEEICQLWDKRIDTAMTERFLQVLYQHGEFAEITHLLPCGLQYPRSAELFLYASAERMLKEKMLNIAEILAR